jgi:hypothetical protein
MSEKTKTTDPQDLIRLLKDLFASDLTDIQSEKLRSFISGKGHITLGNRKYTKEDLKDLFYSNN